MDKKIAFLIPCYNESKTTKAFTATGKNNDKYCNIWDMSGNAYEWTMEAHDSANRVGRGDGYYSKAFKTYC